MSINEEIAAQLAVQDYLEADATLMGMLNGGVFLRTVPVRARTPFVKLDRLEAFDLMVINGRRVWTNLLYNIRVVTTGPEWELGAQQAADRLDSILHRQTYTDASVGLIDIIREETFTDETIEDGTLYLHGGGLYRFKAQAV